LHSARPVTHLIIGLLLCAATLRAQQSPTAAALARKVDDHYNHLTTLEAHYTEHYAGMGLNRTESGTLLLKKPGRMRWTYESGKLFLLDGKNAWSYSPGDAEAQKAPAKELDDLRSPLRLLLGHTQLAKELDNLTIAPAGASFVLSGTPKQDAAQRIQSLALTVTADGAITAIRMQESDGAVTDFAFTDMHENVPVPANTFVFTPPPGVVVVNGPPPI